MFLYKKDLSGLDNKMKNEVANIVIDEVRPTQTTLMYALLIT